MREKRSSCWQLEDPDDEGQRVRGAFREQRRGGVSAAAIQTRYKGYRFRSRLEARWAVYLDAVGWTWEYEPEGFNLGDAGMYLPDFLLRSDGREGGPAGTPMLWIEVKAIEPTEDERTKAAALVAQTKIPVAFAVGVPDADRISEGLLGMEWLESFEYSEPTDYPFPSPYDRVYMQRNLASIDAYCFQKWGRPGWNMGCATPDSTDWAAAMRARGARFEHGESGLRA